MTLSLAWNADAAPAPANSNEAAVLWLSARTLAEMRLPGLPRGRDLASTKRMIIELATREGWAFKVAEDGSPLARTVTARGGKRIDYRSEVLPAAARAALVKQNEKQAVGPLSPALSPEGERGIWHWFDAQSSSIKDEAARRLSIICAVHAAMAVGQSKTSAVAAAAARHGTGQSTIHGWLAEIKGVDAADWLPNLAPRWTGGGKEAEVDPALWQELLSLYLRLSKPSFAVCVWKVERIAKERGLRLPPEKTLRRKLKREVDPLVILKMREGKEALNRATPAQIRSVADLHALEWVNVDGHRWDVFVRWPNGKIARPTTVCIQDVYSRKFLSWRTDMSENAVSTRLAFADMIKEFGIPKRATLDNSRAFASKWISGGAETRFRFAIKEDDPFGLLPSLGIDVRWATPFHGQAKPIERSFGLFCDAIAKASPEFEGAYTGNCPKAKPENYGKAAVPLDVFLKVIDREIRAVNARQGRRTEMANGRSVDDVFNESYAASAIGKASPEQLRLALLTAEKAKVDRKTGSIFLFGNQYFAPSLTSRIGEQLLVRFDPDNLHSEIHVYTLKGRFITTAPIWDAVGFGNAQAAQDIGRLKADVRKKTKEAERALNLLSAEEMAARMPDPVKPETPEASIIRPVRVRKGGAVAALSVSSDMAEVVNNPANFDRLRAARAQLKLVQDEE